MADLQLTGLTKHYGSTVAVAGVDLDVRDREFMTLLGPSGSGKTTILRMIAGFIEPTAGAILVDGRPIQDEPPERRDIGMVFQSYALFPHMTVFKNVSFGLERRRIPAAEQQRRVEEVLALVRLAGLEGRYPRQLSGGQQQRVALARALVIRPTLLLLDEPLSNLDAKLRGEVRLEIRRLQRELGITTILVTHDQEEALTVSDRVAVMRDGLLQQVAAPTELYHRPANRFVADFVGKTNFLAATRLDGEGDSRAPSRDRVGQTDGVSHLDDGATASLMAYQLTGGETVLAPHGPARALLGVRPEALSVGATADVAPAGGVHGVAAGGRVDGTPNILAGVVEYRVFLGELVEIGVRLASGDRIVVRTAEASGEAATAGAPVRVWWSAEQTTVLAATD
ncbi:MAG: ABC transporter ATP-binding protein [Chloroflexi bacterium]|nr:ABC transporter ATP-binding protein [Chloroflexota bacterium]